MTSRTFAEVFDAALDNHGCTLGDVRHALARRGLRVSRSTLYRWRDGTNVPGPRKIETLRMLPRVMGLSAAEESDFLAAASRALGFEIRRRRLQPTFSLPYRRHLGTQELPPFAGRSRPLAELVQAVGRDEPVLVTGMGGVGKTRLAQEVLRRSIDDFGNGCEYLELAPGQDRVQVVRNVAQLLSAGPDHSTITAENLHGVLAQMQDQLQGVRLLFLLDNVASAEQVRDLVRAVTAVTWVLTARRMSLKRLGVRSVHLEPLGLAEAVEVLEAHMQGSAVPDGNDRALLERVVDKLGRLPIALRLGASSLTAGMLTSVAELDAWLDAGGLRRGGALFGKLNQLLDRMSAQLPPDAQAVLRVCGVFITPRITIASLRSVCRRAGVPLPVSVWDVLGDHSLVSYPDDNHIELHPLVHSYVQSRVHADRAGAALWSAYQDHYVNLAVTLAEVPDVQRDYRNLIPEQANLLRVAEHVYYQRDWASLRRMWPTLSGYLWNIGDYARYELLDRRCLEAARAQGDVDWTAVLLTELGYVNWVTADRHEADLLLSEAQVIQDGRPGKLLEQARLRRYRAVMVLELGEFDRAVELLVEAEARLSQVDPSREEKLTAAWMLLHSARMTVHNQRGETATAEAAGLAADTWFRAINAPNGSQLDAFKVELGDILMRLGKEAEAEAQWRELLDRRQGFPELPDHAEARLRLGWLAAGRGDRGIAADLVSQALVTFRGCGNLERGRMAERLVESIDDGEDRPPFELLFG